MKSSFLKKGFYLSLVSFIVAISSGFKEIMLAKYYGLSDVADAYTIAIVMPTMLFSIIWNAMNAVFIPSYQRYKNQAKEKEFLNFFFSLIFFFTLSFVCISEFFLDHWVYIFAPGFSIENHNLSVSLARWTFPILIFGGILRVCEGVLEINGNFVLPKSLVIIRNALMVIFLYKFSSTFGIVVAVIALLLGAAIECIIAYFTVLKYERIVLTNDLFNEYTTKVARLAMPILIGSGMNEINQIVDKIIASFLEQGGIVALNYASKLESIITTIFLVNIVTLVFPTISEYVALEKYQKIKEMFNKTLRAIIIVGSLIIYISVFMGEDIIRIAFMRGAFNEAAVNVVSPLFVGYMSVAILATIRGATVNVFAAYGETREIMINTIITVVVNIILDIILARCLGVYGLVIASMLATIISSIRLLLIANKKYISIETWMTIKLIVKSSIAGLMMMIFLLIIKNMLVFNVIENPLILEISKTTVLLISGTIIYLGIMNFLHVEEMANLKSIMKKCTRKKY